MKASLWKLQIIPLNDITIVSGIVIRGKPEIQSEKDIGITTLRKIVSSYFLRPFKFHEVYIKYGSKKEYLKTGQHGEFKIQLEGKIEEEITVHLTESIDSLITLQNYPIRFHNINAKYFVISDIDDTILHSYSTQSIKKLHRLLFRSPIKRKRIEATHKAFLKLRLSHFHFIYLSRSEYNLFNLITTFIQENKLPLGPIFLRKFTRWKRVLSKKVKDQFKYRVLDEIMAQYPDKKLIFFGDDSQFDLEIYSHFALKFPTSVNHIFIHRTKQRVSKKEKRMKIDQRYIDAKINFYSHFKEIEDTLNTIVNETIIRS